MDTNTAEWLNRLRNDKPTAPARRSIWRRIPRPRGAAGQVGAARLPHAA